MIGRRGLLRALGFAAVAPVVAKATGALPDSVLRSTVQPTVVGAGDAVVATDQIGQIASGRIVAPNAVLDFRTGTFVFGPFRSDA